MKAIIIEDEPLVAKDLRKLLSQVDPTIEVLCVLDSVSSCLKYFSENSEPDILFMDVQLSDGVSFDMLNQINLNSPIIFTTAYDEYAIRAFKLNSIDYLLKPVDKSELVRALNKFHRLKIAMDSGLLEGQLKQLLDQIKEPTKQPTYKERLMAHSGKSYIIIEASEIAYIIKDTLIYLVTGNGQKYLTDFQTMEEFDDLLDSKKFYRANRQLIVQIDFVESFRSNVYGKLIAKMKSPLSLNIDISREKAQSFKKWIQ